VAVRVSWRYAGAPGSDDPDAKASPEGAESKPAERGWLILDSCREPLFEAQGADQRDMLTDVTYTVAQYEPTP
jgi:hypothetical protein